MMSLLDKEAPSDPTWHYHADPIDDPGETAVSHANNNHRFEANDDRLGWPFGSHHSASQMVEMADIQSDKNRWHYVANPIDFNE